MRPQMTNTGCGMGAWTGAVLQAAWRRSARPIWFYQRIQIEVDGCLPFLKPSGCNPKKQAKFRSLSATSERSIKSPNNMKKQIHLAIFATLCAVVLVGCASAPKGPLYSEAKASGTLTPPSGKGLVLVYWVYSFAEGGMSEYGNHTMVYVNDQVVENKLQPGSFCSYIAEPGPLKISSGVRTKHSSGEYVASTAIGGVGLVVDAIAQSAQQKKERAGFEVVPGETYFLETHTGSFAESMKPVSKEQGEKKIQECVWLNPPGQ